MSAELITVILTAAGLVITLGGGTLASSAWILKRMDERFVRSEAHVTAQFNKVDEQFNKVDERFNKMDEQFKDIGTQFSELRSELNDVKVAVARLEGPHPRLILPPH